MLDEDGAVPTAVDDGDAQAALDQESCYALGSFGDGFVEGCFLGGGSLWEIGGVFGAVDGGLGI